MRSTANAFLCLALIVAAGLACAGVKKPWRDYSAKPFNSAEWLAGDRVDRGRMIASMFRNSDVHIGNRDMTLQSLGEPDLKKTIEKREVWFYRIELGFGSEGMDLLPISFDDKGRGSVGFVKGDTMSIAAKESEL